MDRFSRCNMRKIKIICISFRNEKWREVIFIILVIKLIFTIKIFRKIPPEHPGPGGIFYGYFLLLITVTNKAASVAIITAAFNGEYPFL